MASQIYELGRRTGLRDGLRAAAAASPADRAEAALRILGVTTYRTARAVLPMWAGYGLLSAADVRRTLARFTTVESDDFDECADPVPMPRRIGGAA